MKKIISYFLTIFVFATFVSKPVEAKSKEMRAAWIATVYNMDWPKSKSNPEAQKSEFIKLLDELKSVGMNSVVVQVRPKSDAIYKSKRNPWSDVLTGKEGRDPGYDPLQFMIDEAHKRGMELHAWFNPYRVTTSGTNLESLSGNHPARNNPSWVIPYTKNDNSALYYDPGHPKVVDYLVETVMEVVNNYNIDGVHFDDYFYPGQDFNDSQSYRAYGNGMDIHEWRRKNVNTLIQRVHSNIKAVKPHVKFGVSPFGIWKNSSSDPAGSATSGNQSYYNHYADSVAWIKNGWVDYITPQLYWNIGLNVADYSVLVDWWAKQVRGTNVDLYIGQGVYKSEVANEIDKQIELNRRYPEVKGSIYFSTRDIINNSTLKNKLRDIYVNSIEKRKLIGTNRYETSSLISKEGWSQSSDTVILVNAYANADGITATPLAATYNAPILLTQKDYLDKYTKNEIIRLKSKNVILIGGNNVLNDNIIKDIKSINSSINVRRVGGKDRYETSLLIAKEVDKSIDVNNIYVCYGLGEADALSIASKAGAEKTPILLSGKDNVGRDIYEWLKSENVEDAYFIGGETILKNSVINEINSITSKNVSANRIAGANRYETNAEVIRKFYPNNDIEYVMATKGLVLADALTAGPLAAKYNSPVILLGDSLSKGQRSVLSNKFSSVLYEIGGGINQSVLKDLSQTLN